TAAPPGGAPPSCSSGGAPDDPTNPEGGAASRAGRRGFTPPSPRYPNSRMSCAYNRTTGAGVRANRQARQDVRRREAPMSIVDTTELRCEVDPVDLWRLDALERAGDDAESAAVLAASPEVDLHRAVSLIERGCGVDLALQIPL